MRLTITLFNPISTERVGPKCQKQEELQSCNEGYGIVDRRYGDETIENIDGFGPKVTQF